MTANVKECAVVVVCDEDKVNPVNFSWKWGEDDADRRPVNVPWRRYIKILLLGYT